VVHNKFSGATNLALMRAPQSDIGPNRSGQLAKEDEMKLRKALVGVAIAGSTLTGGIVGATLLNGTATAQTTTGAADGRHR
jgi:hypothetical protein